MVVGLGAACFFFVKWAVVTINPVQIVLLRVVFRFGRSCHVGLNKAEQRHALAQAI